MTLWHNIAFKSCIERVFQLIFCTTPSPSHLYNEWKGKDGKFHMGQSLNANSSLRIVVSSPFPEAPRPSRWRSLRSGQSSAPSQSLDSVSLLILYLLEGQCSCIGAGVPVTPKLFVSVIPDLQESPPTSRSSHQIASFLGDSWPSLV